MRALRGAILDTVKVKLKFDLVNHQKTRSQPRVFRWWVKEFSQRKQLGNDAKVFWP